MRPKITIEDRNLTNLELTDENVEAEWIHLLEYNREQDKLAKEFMGEHKLSEKTVTFLRCLADRIDDIIDDKIS